MTKLTGTTALTIAQNLAGGWNAEGIRLYSVFQHSQFSQEFILSLADDELDMEFVNEVTSRLDRDRWRNSWSTSELADNCERIYEATQYSAMSGASDLYAALLCGLVKPRKRGNENNFELFSGALRGTYSRSGILALIDEGISVENIYNGSLHDIDMELLGAL